MLSRHAAAAAGLYLAALGTVLVLVDANAFSVSVLTIGASLATGAYWREIGPAAGRALLVLLKGIASGLTAVIRGPGEVDRAYAEAKAKVTKQTQALRDQSDVSGAADRRPRRKRRRSIKPSVRFELIKAAGYRCQICGATAKTNGQVQLHVDHKIPVAHGGTDAKANLWVLCSDCNLGKGTRRL
jgi:hypothetical protein